jgi:hypothetical protein
MNGGGDDGEPKQLDAKPFGRLSAEFRLEKACDVIFQLLAEP